MKDQPYLNREIDEKLHDIKETLVRIEVQTTKTNGRVSRHDEEFTRIKTRDGYILGFCACVTIVVIPFLYFVASIYFK
jgi:hypothetical protein